MLDGEEGKSEAEAIYERFTEAVNMRPPSEAAQQRAARWVGIEGHVEA